MTGTQVAAVRVPFTGCQCTHRPRGDPAGVVDVEPPGEAGQRHDVPFGLLLWSPGQEPVGEPRERPTLIS
jgi:hypothetical protein